MCIVLRSLLLNTHTILTLIKDIKRTHSFINDDSNVSVSVTGWHIYYLLGWMALLVDRFCPRGYS